MPHSWPHIGPIPLLAAVALCAVAAALLLVPIATHRRGCPCASQGTQWRAGPSSDGAGSDGAGSDGAGSAAQQRRHQHQHQQQQQQQHQQQQQQQQQAADLLESAGSWPLPAVPQCRVIEGSPELCAWCNATFAAAAAVHPLRDRFEASYVPGSPCAMPPGLLDKLRRGGRVTINVVGGSMTYGHGCDDGRANDTRCAWPARLQARLSQLFPAADVAVANRAKPMYSYTEYLSDWPPDLAAADVLIVDLQVNSQGYANRDGWDFVREMEELDAFLHQALAAAYEQRRHQGVLFVETFRLCATATHDCNSHCPEARQGYVDFNHTGSPMRYWWCNRWWTIATIERPVAQHYGLPIASYRDAVWPDPSAPSQMLPCFWNGWSHPDVLGHIMVGDVVAYALLRAAEAAEAVAAGLSGSSSGGRGGGGGGGACGPLRPPTRFHQLLPARAYCGAAAAGVRMTAEQPDTFLPVANTGCWSFFADRPGKPGWICQRGLGAPPAAATPPPAAEAGARLSATEADAVATAAGADALAFRVTFGARPQLEITYLISYTHMGAARVTLLRPDGTAVDGASWTLDAAISEKFSVPRATVLYHASAAKAWARQPHAHQLPDGVGAGEYLLVVALPPRPWQEQEQEPDDAGGAAKPQKFKLMGLASC